MGNTSSYTKEKLVIGILTSRHGRIAEVVNSLEDLFGPVDFRSDPIPFDFTHYYDQEMGTPIIRVFVSMRDLMEPNFLAATKHMTNRLEADFSEQGQRRVNLDPGMMALSRFSLATTKEGSHRLAIGGGIYGEITLTYAGGRFVALPWTYPDYQSADYQEILSTIRERYRRQLKP